MLNERALVPTPSGVRIPLRGACGSPSRMRGPSAWGAGPPVSAPARSAPARPHGPLGWAQSWPSTWARTSSCPPASNRVTKHFHFTCTLFIHIKAINIKIMWTGHQFLNLLKKSIEQSQNILMVSTTNTITNHQLLTIKDGFLQCALGHVTLGLISFNKPPIEGDQ